MDYKACWDLQQELFDALVARKRAERDAGGSTVFPAGDSAEEHSATDDDPVGTVLLVEHPPVYTLGKSGHAENLLIPREMLERMGARFYHIDRGGDITFHGPGQLVCYPILDLERLGIGLRGRLARQGSHSRRKGAGAEDLRNRSAIVTLCYHARLRAQRIDRPGVVLAHQPLRLHRPRGGVDPLGDGPKRPDGGGETFGCGTFK